MPIGTHVGQTFFLVNDRLENVQNLDVYTNDGTLFKQLPGKYSGIAICKVAGSGAAGSWAAYQLAVNE
jgi:hypothetical protein